MSPVPLPFVRLRLRASCLLLAGLAGLSAHAQPQAARASAPTAPDIVLVLVDSLRADHLGCYGHDLDTSPTLDAFAKGAVRFDQAFASGPWTQPAIMSLFTSVPPDVHQRAHWAKPHATNVVTLAEALRQAGYQTVGLTSNPMTHRRFGFARGFEHYDDYTVSLSPEASSRDAAAQAATGATMTRLARNWLERLRDPSRPLFLFVLYMDPHWDYLPPAPFNAMFTDDPVPPPRNIWNLGAARVPEAARRRTLAAYDGEIRYTDGCFSNLLATIDASPRSRNSLVVFCADHGEAFWERGLASHGNNLHDEELHVPLVIRPPRGAPAVGRVVPDQVGLVDVAPTLLDFAGAAPPADWIGRSLRPLMEGAEIPEAPLLLDVRIGKEGIVRGVRTSKLKLIGGHPHDRPAEVYDLAADPGETNNLVKAGAPLPDAVAALVPLLKPREP